MPRQLTRRAVAPTGARWGIRLHRVQALDGGRLAGEEITPIGSPRQLAFGGPHGVIRRLNATGRATLLHCLDGLQEQAAGLDDGFISRPEMLFWSGPQYVPCFPGQPGPVC